MGKESLSQRGTAGDGRRPVQAPGRGHSQHRASGIHPHEALGVWRELLQKALGGRVGGLAQPWLRLCAGPRAAVRQGVGT